MSDYLNDNNISDEENGDIAEYLRDTSENLNGVSSDSASTFEYIEKNLSPEKQWDFSNERDNFSPIETIDHEHVHVTAKPCASTKEEKQRHNEEIVEMESVSASSESWESVPIRHEEVDMKENCRLFLRNERCFGIGDDAPVHSSSSSSSKPCFIDASSLLDEEDLIYTPPPSVCHKSYNAVNQAQLQKSFDLEDGDDQLLPKSYDIKDQYSAVEKPAKKNVKMSHDENASSCEIERHQGNLIFKHAIPQFSGHSLIKHSEDNYTSDLSIYSSTSGGPRELNDFANSSSHFNSLGENTSDGYNSGCNSAGYSRIHSDNDSSIVLPETPFNSIVQVARQLKIYEAGDDVDGDEKVEPSGIASYPIKIPKRSMKYDEFAPVLSGGASVKDFTPKQCESPNLKRRTDTCPIVSGGSVDIEEQEVKPREARRPSASSHSWVVDFNELKIREDDEKIDRQPKSLDYSSSSSNAFGFYVDFNSLTNIEKPSGESKPKTKSKVETQRPTGFYVDFSDSSRPETPKQQIQVPSVKPKAAVSDKKNIFSMFIDFNDEEKKANDAEEIVEEKKVQESPPKVDETPKEDKKGCYMFIESDSPVVKRRANVIAKNETKRHSWNVNPQEGPTEAQRSAKTYQRSTSVTNEKGMINILSKTSSMSIDSSVSPYEDFSCSKSFSSYSNNSATTSNSSIDQSGTKIPLDENLMTQSTKKRRKDAKLNETFDKSSQGSITEGILSNDDSQADTSTDTDDVTFQNNEQDEQQELRKDLSIGDFKSKIMETIPETTESSPLKKLSAKTEDKNSDENEVEMKIETHTMESLQALIEKQKQILENVTEPTSVSFVKLSDLDKPPPPQAHFENSSMSNSAKVSRLFHENTGHRSLTLQYESRNSGNNNNSWNMSRSTGNNLTNLASSVENSKSLSRLFPHLSKGK